MRIKKNIIGHQDMEMIEANTKSNDWVLRIIGHGPCATDYINLVKELGIKRIILKEKRCP